MAAQGQAQVAAGGDALAHPGGDQGGWGVCSDGAGRGDRVGGGPGALGGGTGGLGLAGGCGGGTGALIGGWVVYKIGIAKSLLIFGILQMLSNLSFVWQAQVGHDILVLTAVITMENLTGAMGTSAFVAYFAYLCDKRYTATQYALLTSFMSLGRWVTNAPSGYLVDPVYGMGLSWETYFIISTIIAIPALFMIKYLKINQVR